MPRIIFAESMFKSLRPPQPGEVNAAGRTVTQRIYWSKHQPGFGILLSVAGKWSWIAQRDLPGGKSRRITLGDANPENDHRMSLTAARKAAMLKIAD